MRCLYKCQKMDTGAVNRCAVLGALREEAMATPDREERVKFVPGTKRGKMVRRSPLEISNGPTKDLCRRGVKSVELEEAFP